MRAGERFDAMMARRRATAHRDMMLQLGAFEKFEHLVATGCGSYGEVDVRFAVYANGVLVEGDKMYEPMTKDEARGMWKDLVKAGYTKR